MRKIKFCYYLLKHHYYNCMKNYINKVKSKKQTYQYYNDNNFYKNNLFIKLRKTDKTDIEGMILNLNFQEDNIVNCKNNEIKYESDKDFICSTIEILTSDEEKRDYYILEESYVFKYINSKK